VKSYESARLFTDPERKAKSPDAAITPLCRHYPACGGCQTLEQDISSQLESKHAYLSARLQSITSQEILPMIPSPTSQGYRHKVMLPFGKSQQTGVAAPQGAGNDKTLLGCFAKDSHVVIDQWECHVQDSELTICAYAIREWAQKESVSVYDEKSHHGLLRHVLLRKASGTGEILVGLIINGEVGNPEKWTRELKLHLFAALKDKADAIKGIVLNHNCERTNVTLGNRETLLYGQPFIEERLQNLSFRIRLGSFFQINPLQAMTLFDLAVKNLMPGQKVLDLYAGTGTFTLWAARKTGYAEGWEENSAAVVSAKESSQLNGLEGKAHFVQTEVATQLACDPNILKHYDAVVVDPPRKGLDLSLTKAFVACGPMQIVYVSCNPTSLARDLGILNPAYTIQTIQPVDMMPHTRHVETVVHLKRR
jgi:23S rRNA (uracil1939-C5)-methyltransferase